MTAIELKPLIPAKDFKLSKAFYLELGFNLVFENDQMIQFSLDYTSFLLQNFYNSDLANNLVIHLLVDDALYYWHKWKQIKIDIKYQVLISEPQNQPWGMCDFVLKDPSGVLWRVGNQL